LLQLIDYSKKTKSSISTAGSVITIAVPIVFGAILVALTIRMGIGFICFGVPSSGKHFICVPLMIIFPSSNQ